MPIEQLATADDIYATTDKVKEIIDFLNNIQVAGMGQYMTWVGPEAVVLVRPDYTMPDPVTVEPTVS